MTPQQKQALRWVRRAAEKSKLAAESRDTMIRDALDEGLSVRAVGAAANLSPARVHQIRHGR